MFDRIDCGLTGTMQDKPSLENLEIGCHAPKRTNHSDSAIHLTSARSRIEVQPVEQSLARAEIWRMSAFTELSRSRRLLRTAGVGHED
jgi:hypothetical protein